jgi:serine/threonine protein kinase
MIVGRILDGLGYAHAQGMVHRDLKPQNILMNSDTDVAISDLGLGRPPPVGLTMAAISRSRSFVI